MSDEHETSRRVTDDVQTGTSQEYEDAIASVRVKFEQEHARGVDAGLIAMGPTPRRKRGYDRYCEGPDCPNGIWGPAGMSREDEHPAWLDGRRRDAIFCSHRCRQAHYRWRERQEREEWWDILVAVRDAMIAADGSDLLPLNSKTWKTWRDSAIKIAESVSGP